MSGPANPDDLRIGATERDAAIAAIGAHLVAGRLELDEYERRVTAATEARTPADVRLLFADLPQPHPPLLLSVERGDRLRVTIDVGAFDQAQSGRIVLRLQTQ